MDILKNKIIGLQSAKTPEKGIESIYALVRPQGDGCILSTKFAYPSRNYCDAAFEICFGIAEGCPDIYFSDGCGGFLSLRAEKNICDNQWHRLFAALDRKAGRLSIFIDGCDAAQKDFDPEKLGDIKLRAPILLGHEFDNMINHKNVFRGEIAAACLWSTAVKAEEAENLALSENMIACWKPRESLADLSGNGMELTPYKYFIGRESEEFERYSAPACEGEYTIAFIPDTQTTLFRKELKEQHFKCIYDWLIANRERYNIKMVMGLGDVTEHSSRETNQEFDEPRIAMGRSEWALAKGQFDRLTKANIPWTVILGNHDYGTGGTGRRESLLFDEAFPYDEISRFAHFGGAMDAPQSVLNAYYYLSEGGVDYLLLCLENEPREHTLKWANELIDNHPDHKVIITTHEAIGKDASYTKAMFVYDEEGNVVLTPEGWKKSFRGTYQADLHYECGASGEKLWEDLISRHSNIIMLVCGHLDTANIVCRKDNGAGGRDVYQVVIDTQGIDWRLDPAAAVALAKFSRDGKMISWRLLTTAHGEQMEYTNENGNKATCFEGIFLDEGSNEIVFNL